MNYAAEFRARQRDPSRVTINAVINASTTAIEPGNNTLAVVKAGTVKTAMAQLTVPIVKAM